MAVKIKLQRMGKIRTPHYRVVVADARTRRSGKVIENLGVYEPKANPSVIRIDSDRSAVHQHPASTALLIGQERSPCMGVHWGSRRRGSWDASAQDCMCQSPRVAWPRGQIWKGKCQTCVIGIEDSIFRSIRIPPKDGCECRQRCRVDSKFGTVTYRACATTML